MKHSRKILVVTVASWNSKVGSNSWVSLLENYDSANIANLCIRDEISDSSVCSRYFIISESKVIKSLLKRNIQTGCEVTRSETRIDLNLLEEHNKRYAKMKRKRHYSMLFARELIWKIGRWKTEALDEFLDDFKPDVILHSMEGYIHLNRIIEYAIKRTGARAVGYIWDDNFTYKQSNQIGYKIYRFFQRKSLKRLVKKTSAFFAISPMTKVEADAFFGINCHLLTKPLNAVPILHTGTPGKCIKLLYTGNLYIGREQTLLKVINAIRQLPKGRFYVDVYTNSLLDSEFLDQIDSTICCIHPPIPQNEALRKQREADALLFLEDVDGKHAKVARLSFSTKITDYLSAGKCILAVGNIETAPMQYFIDNNAAIVCGSDTQIRDALACISESPEMLATMAKQAVAAGRKNHDREKILNTFDRVIQSV